MKYQHKEETHNLNSPEIIAPILYKLVQPENVVDVGCGVGTFLYAFKKLGVKEVLGLDGEWADKSLLAKYLKPNEYKSTDLSQFIILNKKFDLALCLEVAEHIDEEYADNLIKTLVNASNIIVFSAASPYQMGQHHVNEQWPEYWINKFLQYDFHFHDILRPAIWNDPHVDFWYKQNMFLVMHKKQLPDEINMNELRKYTFNNIIHPDAFVKRSKFYLEVIEGNMSTNFYLRLLMKRCLYKIGMYKKSGKYR